MDKQAVDCPNAVAVIGISCRFPGARDSEQFWQNLAEGVESIKFFSDEELRAAGVPTELIEHPDYVKAAPVLDDVDLFDARFFQFSPREAALTDPQHRLFLECAWEALESAGYCGDSYDGSVGVFAGTGPSMSCYLASDTHVNPTLFAPSGSREHIGNDKDYLCTRVSYKLNLRGPSINVQTACSTSLVAVHLACQSLLMGESNLALAGGVTIRVPQDKGHLIRDNAMASRDGHCRPFDAEASGTVFGSGVGVVVLKRLADARADGDPIVAVVRGSAVNNDGTSKISFWASSAEGQVPAMIESMAVAEVSPETITYVEAHGTATALGDPVEIQALTRAFRTQTQRCGYCGIGSVKSNVGHLDSAAGIAGFIKAVLALKHAALPPSLHFKSPNPRIDFSDTPFFVNTECRSWDTGPQPRRAAVNSLGIGGTNAFVVLEEAPQTIPVAAEVDRPVHVLSLTAKLPRALRTLAERFAEHFRSHPDLSLADAAFTAGTGRGQFLHRLAVIAETTDEARHGLEQYLQGETADGIIHGEVPRNALPKIALLFTGELSETAAHFYDVYRTQPTFQQSVDHRARQVLAETGTLLLPTLFPQHAPLPDGVQAAPPSLAALALEVSLADLLNAWGAEPILTSGVRAGEVSAACVAGAVSFPDAVQLLVGTRQDWQPGDAAGGTRKLQVRVVSGTSGRLVAEEAGDAEYWRNLDWDTADAERAVKTLVENRAEVLLEIGAETAAWGCAGELLQSPSQIYLSGLPAGRCPWRHLLTQLSELFVRGTPVKWKSFDRDYPRRRIKLPTYPFQRKRYWTDPAPAALSGKYGSHDPRLNQENHPLLGRRLHSAIHPEQVVYETVIDASSPLLAGEPDREEPRTAPASVFRQFAQAAAESALSEKSLQLGEFLDAEPLTIQPHHARVVQIALVPVSPDTFEVQIFSRDRDAAGHPPEWQRHASGQLVRHD
jgi:acyl transferase domain-containing protein